MSKSRKALAFTLSSQYLSFLLQFVTTIIISRLLTPAEVGIFSMAAAFMLLGQLLRDFGTGQYLIQEKDLTTDRIRAAFMVTLATGWSVAALIFLLAPFISGFLAEPGVEAVMRILALNFALIPFGSITLAYLQRQMRFRETMIVRLISALAGAATSITCAYAGMSYYSLAWGAVVGTAASVLATNVIRPKELPRLPGFREMRRVLSFAGQMSASTVISQIGPIINELLIGKFLGVASLGLYSRGQGLVKLFESVVMRGINPVLTPLFAEKHRDGSILATSYLYGTTCLTGLSWPFYATLLVLAPDVITVLFGDNWLAAAPLVQAWSLGAIIRAPIVLNSHLFIATGNISVILHRQLILTPIGVTTTLFTAHISLNAVAIAAIPMSMLWVAAFMPKMMSIAGIIPKQLAKALSPSLIVAICTALCAWLAVWGLGHLGISHAVPRLLAGGSAAGIAFIIVMTLTSHPLVNESLNAFKKLTASKPPGG